jgi:hypothetical protein
MANGDQNNPEEASAVAAALKSQADFYERIAELNEKINNSSGIYQKQLQGQKELLELQEKHRKEASKDTAAAIAAQRKINEELEKQISLREKGLAVGKNYADQIISVNNAILQQSLELGSFSKALGQSVEGFFSKFSSGRGVMTLGIDRIGGATIKAVSALDSAGASFVQATGASRDFATAAFKTRNSLGLMGISGAEAVGVMGDLYSNFSEFSELSRGSQQDFIELSAQIEKLGGDAAGMAQTFTKVAGMSLAETETAMREVAGAADALGIPFSQVSADLVGMGELFAKMGDGALDVFLELQAAAKATGMSVQSLYNIVGQYDTFEASSQAAGRLNMVLGGNLLDTYSLLNATEEERIELLQRAMEQSSMTFDEMDRFQKMEVSDALGISLEEAAQLFGTTRGEVEKTAAELMHAGMSEEELADRTRDASTAMDKFTVLMGNLAIAVGPVVEKVNDLINAFLEATEGMGSTGTALSVLGTGLAAAYAASKLFGLAFGVAFKTAAAAISTSAAPISAGMTSIGAASGGAAAGVGAFGLAVIAIGAGVAIAAYGLSLLVAEFKDLDPASITAAAAALMSFSAATSALGLSSFLGGGRSIKRIVRNINKLETDKVNSFAAAMSSLEGLASVDLAGSGVPGFIKDVGEALDELPDSTEKTVAFQATADSLANLMQIGSSVEAEQLERIKMIIDAVSNAEGAESTNQLIAAISRLLNRQANNEGRTNTIELDGRVLARWLDRYDTTRFRNSVGD